MSRRGSSPRWGRRASFASKVSVPGFLAAFLLSSTTGPAAASGIRQAQLAGLRLPGPVPVPPVPPPPATPRQVATQLDIDQLAMAQAPLLLFADRIQHLVEEQHLEGFAGVTLDGASSVAVYWKGPLPDAVGALVSQLPPGVNFERHDVPYSLTELLAEARRIAGLAVADVGIRITGVGTLDDFSGLDVGVEQTLSASDRQTAAEAINSPLKIVLTSDTTQAEPAVRYSDTSPYWGGGLIDDIDNGFGCTAGVAAETSSGAERMITADHCGPDGSVWWNGDASRIVGTMQSDTTTSASHDAGVLAGQDYDPVIYFGDWDANTGLPVRDRANPPLGAIVYSGGAFDGTHALTVTSINRFEPVGGIGLIGPGFWTDDNNGIGSVGEGDSGGPVTTIEPDGVSVAVRGIHVAIDTTKPPGCAVLWPIPGRECSTRAFHGNIMEAASSLNVTIQLAAPK